MSNPTAQIGQDTTTGCITVHNIFNRPALTPAPEEPQIWRRTGLSSLRLSTRREVRTHRWDQMLAGFRVECWCRSGGAVNTIDEGSAVRALL